jgi:hypothetical protein
VLRFALHWYFEGAEDTQPTIFATGCGRPGLPNAMGFPYVGTMRDSGHHIHGFLNPGKDI